MNGMRSLFHCLPNFYNIYCWYVINAKRLLVDWKAVQAGTFEIETKELKGLTEELSKMQNMKSLELEIVFLKYFCFF